MIPRDMCSGKRNYIPGKHIYQCVYITPVYRTHFREILMARETNRSIKSEFKLASAKRLCGDLRQFFKCQDPPNQLGPTPPSTSISENESEQCTTARCHERFLTPKKHGGKFFALFAVRGNGGWLCQPLIPAALGTPPLLPPGSAPGTHGLSSRKKLHVIKDKRLCLFGGRGEGVSARNCK